MLVNIVMVLVSLCPAHEAKLRKIIDLGYAGNQTEAIRQAITEYFRQIEEEEASLVCQAVERELEQHKQSGAKEYSLAELKKSLGDK